MILALLVLILTCIFLFGLLKNVNELWYCNIKLEAEKKHLLPPGNMGWPILGNMWPFYKSFKSQNPNTFISNLLNRYGLIEMYKTHLFWSPAIIVCTPETCKKVLSDNVNFKPGYPNSTLRLTGKTSFHGITDSEHKRMRRLITSPINGHKALSMYIGCIEDIVIQSLDNLASLDRAIELLNELNIVTFRIIIHIFLGSGVDESTLQTMDKYYVDLLHGIMSSVAINFPGFAFHKALKARVVLVNILQSILDDIRREKTCELIDGQSRGLIHLLVENKDEVSGEKLEDNEIIDMLIIFLLAGHETSAYLIMWAIIYMHRNPQVLQKAREEQVEILKKRPSTQKGLTLWEIRQMGYLNKVIDETLRRANILFTHFREANVDVNLNGYIIPKGWKVFVWSRAVHMDPDNFSIPEEFNPSRWDNEILKVGSFIPFGGGSRICPGADLARLETSIFFHYFLLNYEFEQVNPKCPMVYLPAPKPADNCLGKLIKLPKV